MIQRLDYALLAGGLALAVAGCGGNSQSKSSSYAVTQTVTGAGSGGIEGVGVGTPPPQTRTCGFRSFGKGWHLSATRSVGCHEARAIFRAYFATRGCNGAYAGSCTVRTYRCRYDYRDDVERVACTTARRVIAFRSLA
jgi:hypothetical protein